MTNDRGGENENHCIVMVLQVFVLYVNGLTLKNGNKPLYYFPVMNDVKFDLKYMNLTNLGDDKPEIVIQY